MDRLIVVHKLVHDGKGLNTVWRRGTKGECEQTLQAIRRYMKNNFDNTEWEIIRMERHV